MGAVYTLFSGFYYWLSKITGRRYNEFLGLPHFNSFIYCVIASEPAGWVHIFTKCCGNLNYLFIKYLLIKSIN